MGIQGIATTVFGGMLFPFLILMVWGKGVEERGIFGGLVMGGFIVGTSWLANHGGAPLIVQGQGAPWIDMAWAAGIGIMVHGLVTGGDLKKSMPTLFFAIIGGIIGGYILFAAA